MTQSDKKILDIRKFVCPMNTVHTRLKLDNMKSGEIIEILIKGEEAKENVSSSVIRLGHKIIDIRYHDSDSEFYRIKVIKT